MRLFKFNFLLILVFFTMIFAYILAACLENIPTKLSQPDGTIIDVFRSGDEVHNWVHDKDYYTILQNPHTGFWCWAVAENGDLISTGDKIHLDLSFRSTLKPRENISHVKYLEKRRTL